MSDFNPLHRSHRGLLVALALGAVVYAAPPSWMPALALGTAVAGAVLSWPKHGRELSIMKAGVLTFASATSGLVIADATSASSWEGVLLGMTFAMVVIVLALSGAPTYAKNVSGRVLLSHEEPSQTRPGIIQSTAHRLLRRRSIAPAPTAVDA